VGLEDILFLEKFQENLNEELNSENGCFYPT
jgi:hypothetical protein